jgi:hypothetical protein
MNVDASQKKYEKIIVKCILKFVSPEGIILYGGYGRNEGSWIIGKDQSPKPYNDFDILLVSNKQLSSDLIIKIKKDIKSQISIKWIDLSQIKVYKLKKLKNSIYNYDLKYASKILYGNEKLQSFIPNLKSNTIPLKDIDILFKTRIWTLVGCFGDNSFVQISGASSMFFRNQMAKSVLASVDSFLILKQQYHHSYKQRAKIFLNISNDLEYFELVNWALNEKLRPQDYDMSVTEVKKMYFKVSEFFMKSFFKGLSKYYKQTINSETDVEKIYLYNTRNFIKRQIQNVLYGSGNHNAYMIILQFLCVRYLLNKNERTLKRIKFFSNKIDIFDESFENIRIKISNLRLS